jgi:hypothetical protein
MYGSQKSLQSNQGTGVKYITWSKMGKLFNTSTVLNFKLPTLQFFKSKDGPLVYFTLVQLRSLLVIERLVEFENSLRNEVKVDWNATKNATQFLSEYQRSDYSFSQLLLTDLRHLQFNTVDKLKNPNTFRLLAELSSDNPCCVTDPRYPTLAARNQATNVEVPTVLQSTSNSPAKRERSRSPNPNLASASSASSKKSKGKNKVTLFCDVSLAQGRVPLPQPNTADGAVPAEQINAGMLDDDDDSDSKPKGGPFLEPLTPSEAYGANSWLIDAYRFNPQHGVVQSEKEHFDESLFDEDSDSQEEEGAFYRLFLPPDVERFTGVYFQKFVSSAFGKVFVKENPGLFRLMYAYHVQRPEDVTAPLSLKNFATDREDSDGFNAFLTEGLTSSGGGDAFGLNAVISRGAVVRVLKNSADLGSSEVLPVFPIFTFFLGLDSRDPCCVW